MKKFTKVISAVLTAALLTGTLVFSGAAWEDKVSPWAVKEMAEAIELGLQKDDFYSKCGKGKNSWDEISRLHFTKEVEDFMSYQLRLNLDTTPLYEYRKTPRDENGTMIPYFKDVQDDWSINFAHNYGIVHGRGDGTFDPNAPITREEAAVMLYNTYLAYAKNGEAGVPELNLSQFADQDEISPWARQAVSTMAAWDVMTGMSETEFGPKSHYTYEQCWVTFLRLYKNAPEGRLQGSVKMPDGWDQDVALANLRDGMGYTENFCAKTEKYVVIYGGQVTGRYDSRKLHIFYKDGGWERLEIPYLKYDITSDNFSLDEEHDILYCTNDSGEVYKVDLIAATVEAAAAIDEREWETEEYTVSLGGQSDGDYNFRSVWIYYKDDRRDRIDIPVLKYDATSENVSFDEEHGILSCSNDSGFLYKVDLNTRNVEIAGEIEP